MDNLNGHNSYRRNHYVPEWYQKRFLNPGQFKLWHLDMKPGVRESNCHTWIPKSITQRGPDGCFRENDLYTTKFGSFTNTEIERLFFGRIDGSAEFAINHFEKLELNESTDEAFNIFVPYLSLQKLRTPKGLAALRQLVGNNDRNQLLLALQKFKNLFCAIWTECVWQIADASSSATKFIVSDHPVTVYNRECFPDSKWCQGDADPEITRVASHTVFPLSLQKILILTNLAWVRDPYQNPLSIRPNPKLLRQPALFNFTEIQFDRFLSQEEVIEINYVIKRRARRYIAAAEREWLFPEKHLSCDHWRKLGDGYLLMPDPRHVFTGGEMVVGYSGGTYDWFSAYGHRPWQKGYENKNRDDREWNALNRFKAEWSATYGPNYRGLSRSFGQMEDPQKSEGIDYHNEEVERDKAYRKQPGERQRRRQLSRPK